MRSLLTLLLLCFMAPPAAADDTLARLFASCTGRLSAEMEHKWLLGHPADTIENQRKAMISLLDAVRGDLSGQDVLNIRIDAKFAHAALLHRAMFNQNASDANWAATRAELELSHCAALVLS